MLHLKRFLRGVVLALSALIVALLCVVLSAPLWINEAAVKSEIAGLVARATGDVMEVDRIQLHYLPLPGVVVSRPKYAVPGIAEIEARSATIRIDLWALLSGRVQPRVVDLSEARISLRLPVNEPDTAPLSVEDIHQRLGQFVAQITKAMPDLRATIENARVEVLIRDRPPLLMQTVHARVSVSDGSIDGELVGGSNLWQRLALTFSLSAAGPGGKSRGDIAPGSSSLDGGGRIDVVGLQVTALQNLLGLASSSPVTDALIVGRIDWRMQGLQNLNADLIASAGQVTVRHGTRLHAFSGATLAAGFQSRGNAWEANLHRLYLRSPHLMLSGKLARNERDVYALEGNASGVDVDELLAVARSIAPDSSWIAQSYFEVHGGTLSALRFGSQADSPAELFRLDRLDIDAALEGVGIDIARKGIRIRDVACHIAMAHGELRIKTLSAGIGQSVLRNAHLETDLLTEPITLNGEAELALDLPESLVLAKKLLPASTVRSQLNEIEYVKGSAIVRVAMEGSLKAPLLRVEVRETDFVARHRAVPLPIRIAKGQATFAGDAFSLHAVDGYVGNSSFTGLDASFGTQPPYRFNVRQDRAALSAAELFRWAAALPEYGKALVAVKRVSGTIELSGSQVQGAIQKPEDLQLRTIANPRSLVVFAPDLGPELRIDGGVLELSGRKLDLKNVGVEFSDGALRVSGRIPDYRQPGASLDATASGKLGAEALAWIYNTTGAPRPLQMRAPIEVANAALRMKGLDDISFKGGLSIVGGPALGVEGRRVAKTWEIDRVTVKDADSDSSFGGKLADGNAEAWFKGRLSGKTLPRALVEPAFALGELQGDLAVKVNLARIEEAVAQGHLAGSAINFAKNLPISVEVERFTLEADNGKIVVRQADVSSGESRIALAGTIERRAGKFIVDADLTSERIVVPILDKAAEAEAADEPEQDAFDLSKVPFEGRVAVKIQKVKRGSLEIDGLIASAKLADAKFDLVITSATLCGLAFSGIAAGGMEDVQSNVTLRARDAPLAGSIACLTGEQIQASGQVDLDAQFTARGALGSLYEHLNGTFSFTARDGNLRQAAPLNRVFGLLNVTDVMRGKKLEFGASGLPYRTMSAHGMREGTLIRFQEMMLDAPSVQIAAEGQIDVVTGKLAFDAMVAPLQTANYVLQRMPLLNRIFGGSVLAVPVQVSGTLTNPIVVPLGPGAVARRLTAVFGNVLKLPVDAIKVFSPGAESPDKNPPSRNPN